MKGHIAVRKNLQAAKSETPLQLKDSFAVLIDLIFAPCLTQVLIRFIIEKALSHINGVCGRPPRAVNRKIDTLGK